jgi:hypothetical protein
MLNAPAIGDLERLREQLTGALAGSSAMSEGK